MHSLPRFCRWVAIDGLLGFYEQSVHVRERIKVVATRYLALRCSLKAVVSSATHEVTLPETSTPTARCRGLQSNVTFVLGLNLKVPLRVSRAGNEKLLKT